MLRRYYRQGMGNSDIKVMLQSSRLSLMYADALNTNTPSGKEKKDHRCADMDVL